MCASVHFRSPLPLPFSFLDCSNQAHLRHPPPKPTLVFGMHCTFAKPSHERQHSRVPPVSAITPQGNLPSSIAPSIAIRNTDDPQPNGKQVMLLKFRVCTHPQSVACRIWPALGIHIFFLLQMSWPKELAHATSSNIGQGRATPHVNINTVLVTYFQFLAVVHLRPTSPCVEFVGAR